MLAGAWFPARLRAEQVVLAGEPAGSLDRATGESILALLREAGTTGLSSALAPSPRSHNTTT
jgi:ABC-type lipoprotein export system ATPase subunit